MENFIIFIILAVLVLNVNFEYVGTTQHKVRSNKLYYYPLHDGRPLKKALGFDEDTYFNFTELTNKYNYPTEEHQVTTEDGYILKLFRILPKCDHAVGYPIILLHGIFDTADTWILAGAKSGLGFILAGNCYDVWAANHRGNVYSRKHVSYDPNTDPEFWNYSFDEHGFYDVPAMIDYVTRTTGLPKVNYIGHSQGTTDFFVTTSLRPRYNAKIQFSILLAPVVYLKYLGNPFLKLIAPRANGIKDALDKAGFSELLAKHQLIHTFVELSCKFAPLRVCGLGLYTATGYKQGTITSKTLSVAAGHLLAGISTKSLAHFGQLITSHQFCRYDEGTMGNLKRYGSVRPPEYNLSQVTAPVLLVTGKNDWLSSMEDVHKLALKLPNLVENYIVPDPHWSHNNHLWGREAHQHIFPKVLENLKTFNS